MGTADANGALMLEAFEAFSAGDLDTLQAAIAPDLVMHSAGAAEAVRGVQTWRAGVELMKQAFPDLEAQVDDIVAAEEKVAIRVTYRGTHGGDFQGIPATGRSVEFVSHEFYRFEAGRIVEEWICSDTASLFHQLG